MGTNAEPAEMSIFPVIECPANLNCTPAQINP